jgi:hypothetical protein
MRLSKTSSAAAKADAARSTACLVICAGEAHPAPAPAAAAAVGGRPNEYVHDDVSPRAMDGGAAALGEPESWSYAVVRAAGRGRGGGGAGELAQGLALEAPRDVLGASGAVRRGSARFRAVSRWPEPLHACLQSGRRRAAPTASGR